jgi:Cys-Gly metallodipeptidase DUG1
LHSGVFGGTVHEPMTDLIQVMSTLVDTRGKILVPGVYDTVAPVTTEELEIYKKIQFSLDDIHNAAAAKNTVHDSAVDALMARWRFPTLSLHGIEGAYYSPGSKTVIPAKVIGKFSIRSVPNQEPSEITKLVQKHVTEHFEKLGTKNSMTIECDHAGKCWVANTNHWNYGI